MPPKVTPAPPVTPVKLVPEMVTTVPPAVGPWFGETDVMMGRGTVPAEAESVADAGIPSEEETAAVEDRLVPVVMPLATAPVKVIAERAVPAEMGRVPE